MAAEVLAFAECVAYTNRIVSWDVDTEKVSQGTIQLRRSGWYHCFPEFLSIIDTQQLITRNQ